MFNLKFVQRFLHLNWPPLHELENTWHMFSRTCTNVTRFLIITLLTYNEWQSIYEVQSHSSSSSFVMSSSPITIRLYSGLHHVSLCVLILLTDVDRKEVWNDRRGRNNQWTWTPLIRVVTFPNPSAVKSHCTIFLLMQPWAPQLPCMAQYWEEDLVLHITQLFVLRFQLNIILLHSRGTTVAQWLRCCSTNLKVAGSIPAGVCGFFIDIKSFWSHYGPGVDSVSDRNEYQEYFLGIKAAGA